jgi:hypothetical protein
MPPPSTIQLWASINQAINQSINQSICTLPSLSHSLILSLSRLPYLHVRCIHTHTHHASHHIATTCTERMTRTNTKDYRHTDISRCIGIGPWPSSISSSSSSSSSSISSSSSSSSISSSSSSSSTSSSSSSTTSHISSA